MKLAGTLFSMTEAKRGWVNMHNPYSYNEFWFQNRHPGPRGRGLQKFWIGVLGPILKNWPMLTEKYGVDTPLLMEIYVKIDPCLWRFLRKIVRKPPFYFENRPIFPTFKRIDPSLRKFIQNTPLFTENRPLPMELKAKIWPLLMEL